MDYIRRVKPRKSVSRTHESIVLFFQRMGYQFRSEDNITQSSRTTETLWFLFNRLAGVANLEIITHPDEIEIRARYRNPLYVVGVLLLMAVVGLGLYRMDYVGMWSTHPWSAAFLSAPLAVIASMCVWPQRLWHPLVSRKLDQVFSNIEIDRYPLQ